MGLLDWMTEGLGNVMQSASPGTMPPDMAAVMPPMQQTGDDNPMQPPAPPMPAAQPPLNFQRPEFARGRPLPPGGDPMDGTGSGNNGGLPPPPPSASFAQGGDPMAGTGSGLDGGLPPPVPSGPGALPPGATPTAGTMPPGPPMLLAPPSGAPGDVPGPNGKLNGASSWIGGKLGLDSNKEKSLFGSLGQGLTAAGNSKGKSKGQALFSGAGGAIEGGQKAEEKSYDQRIKSLQLAVAAQKAGDSANYQLNYAKYLGAKLKADTDKAANGGKNGAWNKPDSQKYIDANNMVTKDRDVETAAKAVQKMLPTNPNYAAAQAHLSELIQQKKQEAYSVMQLSPQTIAAMNGNPPGSPPKMGQDGKMTGGNPHTVASQQDFDRYVKPGDAYINPRDQKVYIRKGSGDGASDSAAASTAPNTPPEPPGLPPERGGESDEHEEL